LDTEFLISSQEPLTTGFAIWYLKRAPTINRNPGALFGMNEDYNGLGIFVFKSQESNIFNIAGVFNRGMDYVRLNEEMLNVQNSCKIAGNVIGIEKVIRVDY